MSSRPTVESVTWDSNGSHRVIVSGPWPRTEASERAARRAARGADPMGREHVRWTRLDAVRDEFDEDGKGVRIVYTFTVSRLSREHYSRRAVRHQIRRAGHHLTLTDDPALPLAWAKN